jgi:hypothetical protein
MPEKAPKWPFYLRYSVHLAAPFGWPDPPGSEGLRQPSNRVGHRAPGLRPLGGVR